jgi:hypothetical protein
MSDVFSIFVHGFWPGFVDKTDANHITFFENIFSRTKIRNYTITNDIQKANVLFESVFAKSVVPVKSWKYKIHYSGEPFVGNPTDYDVVLFSHESQANIVDLPLFVYYIHGNNYMDALLHRPVITSVPTKFCCFIVSNGSCHIRNQMFQMLNQYKKVDSYGAFQNNMGGKLPLSYWTPEFRAFIRQYKFIICFENSCQGTYSTEKIVNPYLAGIIPIYWSSPHIHSFFSPDSMLFLDTAAGDSYQQLIDRVIALDTSDTDYLEFVNRPIVVDSAYWNDHYTIDAIANKLDRLL